MEVLRSIRCNLKIERSDPMKLKDFFPNLLRPIKEDLDDFDPEMVREALNPVLPSDIPIIKLNDFEQRCLAWLCYAEVILAAITNQELKNKRVRSERFRREFIENQTIMFLKIKEVEEMIENSVSERRDKKLAEIEQPVGSGILLRQDGVLVLVANLEAEEARLMCEAERINQCLAEPAGRTIH